MKAIRDYRWIQAYGRSMRYVLVQDGVVNWLVRPTEYHLRAGGKRNHERKTGGLLTQASCL